VIRRCAPCRPAAPKETFDSLIPEILSDLESDDEYQALLQDTEERGQYALTKEENEKRQAILASAKIPSWPNKMKVYANL
jgi:hypothetical protein